MGAERTAVLENRDLISIGPAVRKLPATRSMAPPKAFHIMAKPTGSACNINCDYCFFLKKEALYPDSNFRMSDEVHDAYIRQLFAGHQVPQVTVADRKSVV